MQTTGFAFLDWLNSHARCLGLSIAIHKEFYQIWPEVAAARARLDFRGHDLHGSGYGRSQAQAVIVAVAELIERCCLIACTSPVRSSSGFAVHTDPAQAEQAAVFELLERDAFLCHHFTKTPFLPIQPNKELLQAAPTLNTLLRLSDSRGLKIQLGGMNVIGAGHGRVVALDGAEFSPRFGTIVASAYDLDPQRAIERCCREVMAILAFRATANLWDGIDLAEFSRQTHHGPNHHARYSLYPDKMEWLRTYFGESPVGSMNLSTVPHVNVHVLRIPPELGNPPIHARRATSSDIQDLFFGPPTKDAVNLGRLSQFAGRPVRLAEVEQCGPHLLD